MKKSKRKVNCANRSHQCGPLCQFQSILKMGRGTPGVFNFRINRERLVALGKLAESGLTPFIDVPIEHAPGAFSTLRFTIVAFGEPLVLTPDDTFSLLP